jgi:hypothetical protein
MNDTIAQIRKAREEISEQCGFDSKRLIDFYLERARRRELRHAEAAEAGMRPDLSRRQQEK